MSAHKKSNKKTAVSKTKLKGKQVKREASEADLVKLEARIANLATSNTPFTLLIELPLTRATAQGLTEAKYETMTPIQAKALPLALQGKDVLGAARTGSGKTLAFLIPVLESLYRKKWNALDGLGALIISPTRELAVQIFQVLRKIGGHHSFSAGLVIGGKNLKEEKERMASMNILVATPGRLLQHMDQTVDFVLDNLQVLVLDEADRILDLGFAASLNAIITHLPEDRQTLLFSATQTKSVKDLARLSLRNPEYVSVREAQSILTEDDQNLETPSQLVQHYTIVELQSKMDTLWSFIKTHLYHKTLVFLSSCKQVRFVYEAFRHLRPGVPLLHLHGKQKQMQRLEIYDRFTKAENAILFATDIAARGLDFPGVGWVLQVDCPEDVDTYVHRVGRTARYNSKGKALLFLCPSEEPGMLKRFDKKGLQVDKIKLRDNKQQTVQKQLQSLSFRSTEIKYLAQKAFMSYVRSIHLQKDKGVFKFADLPLEEYASSLGLAGTPQIKFTSKESAFNRKNASRNVEQLEAAEPDDAQDLDASTSEDDEQETSNVFGEPASAITENSSREDKPVKTRMDRMFQRKNQGILSQHYDQLVDRQRNNGETGFADDGDDDDFMTIKRVDHSLREDAALEKDTSELSKRKLKAGQSRKAMLAAKGLGTKLTFDDEGDAHPLYELQTEQDFRQAGDAKTQGDNYVAVERLVLQSRDVADKARQKDLKREKKRKRKEREQQVDNGDTLAELAPVEEDDGYVSPVFDLPSEDDDNGRISREVEEPSRKRKRKVK